MLIKRILDVEENKESTEFNSTASPNHECDIYVTGPDFRFFWRFLEDFFLKMLHEDVCNYRRNGKTYSCPRSLFIELVVVREVCGC